MTSLRTPEPDVDRAFALAIERAQIMLGRPDALEAADQIGLASALLGAGIRAPARDLLRQRETGGFLPGASAALEGLSGRYHAWVGEPPGSSADRAPAGPAPSPTSVRMTADALARDPDAPGAVAGVLDAVVSSLWGLAPDAGAGAIAIRPEPPAGWRSMALARVRVGRTVLDLGQRRQRSALVARVHRVSGPPLVVTLEPRPAPPGPTFVDDVELRGARVRFEAVERHEIVFHGAPG